MSEHTAKLDELAERWRLSGLEPVGKGLEFSVYRAPGPDGNPVALRLAHRRFDANANDPHVDTRLLLQQEYAITRHLAEHGLPVAEPLELVLAADPSSPDVLMSVFVPDDGSDIDSFGLGQLLARLHSTPPPRVMPVAAEGAPTATALAVRIRRRWAEVGKHVDGWPAPPDPSVLAGHLTAVTEESLVHLDVRGDNIRRTGGRVTALLDWSNALLGSSALELGRLIEYARYPENTLDLAAVRTGYETTRPLPPDDDPAVTTCRLDAALMLALVFLSEAPDPLRGRPAAEHAREIGQRLAALRP
jgi:Ser/Thr protein kinase RdoA (MazF antagonist)